MAANFESIFSSATTQVGPDLNKIFSRKVKKEKDTETKKKTKSSEIPDMDEMNDDYEPLSTKPKKLSPETEKRTIFVGNLSTDCKKEVNKFIFICC